MICNLIIAALVIHFFIYLGIILKKIVDFGKEKKSELFSIVNNKSRSAYYILILVASKDTILPFILIFAATYPTIQISSIAISFIIILVYTGVFWPYKEATDNWLGCLNCSSYFVVMVLFGVLYFFDNSISEENKY